MDFWKKFGYKKVNELCLAAGTTYDYWKLIAYGHKRPSVDLAYRLVDKSEGILEFKALLPPKEELSQILALRKAKAQEKASLKGKSKTLINE